MNILSELDRLLDLGNSVSGVFFGRSVIPGVARFATLRKSDGNTLASGRGETSEEALIDALAQMGSPPPVASVLPLPLPEMVPANKPAMPGIRKMPGL
jgi:hypothetical protein